MCCSIKISMGIKAEIGCITTFVILLILSDDSASSNEQVCPTLKHSTNITISKVLGTWYAVRGIEHTNLENIKKFGSKSDCRSLNISQTQQDEITFQWNGTKEIKVHSNDDNPNLWQTTLLNLTSNGPPIKTLQVTEVDDKHIILTVCSPSKRLSSAVLHREPNFKQDAVLVATNKLAEQNLNVVNTFDRCQA